MSTTISSHLLLRRLAFPRPITSHIPISRPSISPLLRSHRRLLSNTTKLSYPRKDSQDRESINTDATEYSKSGSDDASAQQEEAAFDPDKTSPEAEKQKAGEGNEGNPLEVSPANPDVSEQKGDRAEKGGKDRGPSGGGSPNKAG